jgi:hypothetical protein
VSPAAAPILQITLLSSLQELHCHLSVSNFQSLPHSQQSLKMLLELLQAAATTLIGCCVIIANAAAAAGLLLPLRGLIGLPGEDSELGGSHHEHWAMQILWLVALQLPLQHPSPSDVEGI